MNHFFKSLLAIAFVALASFTILVLKPKPTLYIIGDSTVRNSNAPQMGWGSLINVHFDTTKISIANHAMAGRSSRSFTNESRWAKVDSLLKSGDFVLMQFGHNDGSYPDTTAKNRGTLKGTGEDTMQLVWADGRRETVHSYGWYIRQFVKAAKAKGATPIILSMIPRNKFKDGKVERAGNFGVWAKEVADQEDVMYIDLNAITADKYDAIGPDKVKDFFSGDHTHTNREGARINAASVAEGIRQVKACQLNQYLKKINHRKIKSQ